MFNSVWTTEAHVYPSKTTRVAPINRYYEKKLAIDRIRAARLTIDSSGSGIVLTGRCEAWLVHDPNPLPDLVLDRLYCCLR